MTQHYKESTKLNPFWPVLLLLIGTLVLFYPTIFYGFSKIQVNEGDSRFNNYLLENAYRALTQSGSIWDPNFYYPTLGAGAYGDLLLTYSPPYILLRLLGFEYDTSFQLWMIFISFTNFLLAFWLLNKELKFSAPASSLGSFFFAFASIRANQLNHQQLFTGAYLVFSAIGVTRLLTSSSRRSSYLASTIIFAGLSLQFYSGFYLTWFAILFLSIWVFISLFETSDRGVLKEIVVNNKFPLAFLFILFALSITPLLIRYLSVAHTVGFRTLDSIRPFMPTPESWFYPGPNSLFFGWTYSIPLFRSQTFEGEKRLGIGVVTLAIIVFGFLTQKGRYRLSSLGAVSFLLVLSTILISNWALWDYIFQYVPGAKAIRAPGRIAILLLLPFSIAIAQSIDQIRSRYSRDIIIIIISIIVVGEQLVITESYRKEPSSSVVKSLSASLNGSKASCESFIYLATNGKHQPWKYQLDAMWAAIVTGIPTINGYSGNMPLGWDFEQMGRSSNDPTSTSISFIDKWVSVNNLKNVCVIPNPPLRGKNPRTVSLEKWRKMGARVVK